MNSLGKKVHDPGNDQKTINFSIRTTEIEVDETLA